METKQRSSCPINLTMEALGDRWSLIIVGDMMFANRRHFRELLSQSVEGIASNVLTARLKRLTELGFITRADDPTHMQKGVYSLTEKAIQLVPVLAMIGAWGRKHLPVSEELGNPRPNAGGRRPENVGGVHGRAANPPPAPGGQACPRPRIGAPKADGSISGGRAEALAPTESGVGTTRRRRNSLRRAQTFGLATETFGHRREITRAMS